MVRKVRSQLTVLRGHRLAETAPVVVISRRLRPRTIVAMATKFCLRDGTGI